MKANRQFIFAGIAAAALLAGGGYAFSWMRAASAAEQGLVKLMKDSPFLTGEYASLKREGFLGNVRFTLEQPKLTFNSEKILKEYFPATYKEYVSEGTKRNPGFNDWTETLTWRDKLVIEADPFSGKISILAGGEILHRSEIDGDVLYTTLRSAPDSQIALELGRPNAKGFVWGTLGAEAARSYPELRSVNGISAAFSNVTWDLRNSTLKPFSADSLHADAHEADADTLKLTLALRNSLQDNAALRRAETHYYTLFNRKHEKPGAIHRVFTLTNGKLNLDLDADVKRGATLPEGTASGITIHVAKLSAQDEDGVRATTGDIILASPDQNGRRRGLAKLKVNAEFAAGWQERWRAMLTRYASSYLSSPDYWEEAASLAPMAGEWMESYRDNPRRFGAQMALNFQDLTPDLHRLGKTETNVTTAFMLEADGSPALFDMKDLSFRSEKYGADLAKQREGSNTRYTLHLTNYPAFTADATDYGARLLTARKRLHPEAPTVTFNEGFEEAASVFLSQLADDGGTSSENEITFTVNLDEDHNFSVGNKDAFALAGEALNVMAPFMQIKGAGIASQATANSDVPPLPK